MAPTDGRALRQSRVAAIRNSQDLLAPSLTDDETLEAPAGTTAALRGTASPTSGRIPRCLWLAACDLLCGARVSNTAFGLVTLTGLLSVPTVLILGQRQEEVETRLVSQPPKTHLADEKDIKRINWQQVVPEALKHEVREVVTVDCKAFGVSRHLRVSLSNDRLVNYNLPEDGTGTGNFHIVKELRGHFTVQPFPLVGWKENSFYNPAAGQAFATLKAGSEQTLDMGALRIGPAGALVFLGYATLETRNGQQKNLPIIIVNALTGC